MDGARPDRDTLGGRSSYRTRGLADGLGYGLGRVDDTPLQLPSPPAREPDDARRLCERMDATGSWA